ncbi:MAG: haloacid dehalogenase type II, partial [Methyloligellaceae bacterium]
RWTVMNDFPAVDAIAFDYYGTIANKQGLGSLIEADFPGKGEAVAKLWFATCQRYCFQNGMMDRYVPWDELTKAALKFAAAEIGITPSPSLVDSWISADQSTPIYTEAASALKRLKKRHGLFVLSMGSSWMIEQSQREAGISEYFDRVITTQPDQIYKPSKAAYEIGVREIGRSKQKIAFVSGNSFDVIGAKNFGFPTAWVRRYEQPLDDLGLTPDAVVHDLSELADLLGA